MSAAAAIEIVLYSGLLPAATALAIYFLLGWMLPDEVGRRYRLGAAFALAVFAGFALAPNTKSLAPAQFWDWIPYVGLLAAWASGLTQAAGVTRGERWLTTLAVASAAAWLIVPTWEEMADSRTMQVAALAAGIAALTFALEPLADRLTGRALSFWLMLAAGALAILMMAEVSVTFGRLAALPAAALAGSTIAAMFAKDTPNFKNLALPYAVIVGGYAFTGFIYPNPPLALLLLIPFAPLALWACALGPLAGVTGFRAIVAQTICILVPLVIIAAIIVAQSGADEW